MSDDHGLRRDAEGEAWVQWGDEVRRKIDRFLRKPMNGEHSLTAECESVTAMAICTASRRKPLTQTVVAKIVKRKCIQVLRKQNTDKNAPNCTDAKSACEMEDFGSQRMDDPAVALTEGIGEDGLLGMLSAEDRELVVLNIVDGVTLEEIAEGRGLTKGAVGYRIQKSLGVLRTAIEAEWCIESGPRVGRPATRPVARVLPD